ncbi:MAG TPA: M48 family metallopeptidase [Phycisphaerales bacterium]|nr:M48 family metallopeptidase [Phycisphaerales bacterium]
MRLKKTPAAALVALSVLPLASCSTNPATGRSQFNAISPEQEIALGVQSTPQVVQQYGGKYGDASVQAYTTEIGQKLARGTEGDNPKLPWEFTMLDSDIINAFALPGGKVFFSRGLAAQLKNEAQFAGVLGHEIGHVTARHINDQVVREQVASVGGELAGSLLESKAGIGGQLTPTLIQLGQQSVLLRFSRKQELEADSLGMRYMAKAGYDPEALLGVMDVLAAAMEGNRGVEFFSTHPYPDTRVANIKEQLSSNYSSSLTKLELGADAYQRRMLSKLKGVRRSDAGASKASFGDLGDPVLWCAHCREDAEHAQAKD